MLNLAFRNWSALAPGYNVQSVRSRHRLRGQPVHFLRRAATKPRSANERKQLRQIVEAREPGHNLRL